MGWRSLRAAIRVRQADVIALGEAHGRKVDSDLRIRLIRHTGFPHKARFIVIELGRSELQPIIDRYVGGEDVPAAEAEQLWQKQALQHAFYNAVRDVNRTLSPDRRLRVLAADQRSAPDRTALAMSLLRGVLKQGGKALVLYGAGHVWHGAGGITSALERDIPGRVFAAETLAPVSIGRAGPEFDALDASLQSLERTLQSAARPVLVTLGGHPAAKLLANPFYLGQATLPSTTTLGDIDDAVVYFGRTADVGTFVR